MREEWGVSVGQSIIWRTNVERDESDIIIGIILVRNIIEMDGSGIVVPIRIRIN